MSAITMATEEASALTFKDVWEKEETDASVVAYFETLKMANTPLSWYFSTETGELLPPMKPLFDRILQRYTEEGLKKLQYLKFLGHCGNHCCESKGTKKRKYEDHQRFRDMISPSQFGKNENWSSVQEKPTKRIMCSRPYGASLINITLMHPIFQEIIDVLERGDPIRQDYELAARLACVQPDSYYSNRWRRDEVNDLLNEYVAIPNNEMIAPRIVVRILESGGSVGGFFNVVYKDENSDPYMESAAYYALYWSYKDGPDYHCCPWLMMEVDEHKIGLSGGAWACGSPCVQPLSSKVPFLDLPLNRNIKQTQARLCMAFRIGFAGLAAWYRDVVPTLSKPNPQAQFPYQRTFTDGNGTDVGLRYEEKIHHPANNNALFRATRLDTNEEVIVKFTPWYGESVHKLLANHDLAPKLFACEDVAGMKMVVMGYCTGTEMWPHSPSDAHVKLLKNAVRLLGQNNFVHGDLRKPNVLIAGEKIRIIDFDWAGTVGTAKYPVCLSISENWHRDAGVSCSIEKTHDQYMVQRLCNERARY